MIQNPMVRRARRAYALTQGPKPPGRRYGPPVRLKAIKVAVERLRELQRAQRTG